jgi:putative serine protease PepD
MTDEQRPADSGDGAGEGTTSPWWVSSPREVWDAPPVEPEPAARRPEQPEQPGQPEQPERPEPPADTLDTERHGAVYDVWAPTDTVGREPRPAGGSRTGVLVALAVAIALLAGLAGGALGFLLAERDSGSVTVDGASLGAAPARNVSRPDGSIPGVAARVLPSVVQIKVDTPDGQATGSGFVIDENGILVTNNHVVADAQGAVELTFSDGTSTTAKVLGTSGSYDLAVLKVAAKNLPALPLGNSDSVVVGDPVLAIGSPLGLSGTVTSGIVSAKNRPVTAGGGQGGSDAAYINAIQTDAAINPGNSGGPLVDIEGEVIGVNSAIATVGGGLGGESGNIGVGFAIPINQVRRTVEQLLNKGQAEFPVIGASLDASYNGEGARIAAGGAAGGPAILPGGPAEKAGLQAGDLILALDGKAVLGSSELIVAIRSKQPGDTVTLTVRRNGSEHDVKVTLGASEG